MKATCTISRTPDGDWLARHESADLGAVEVRGSSSEATLMKMQRELQHRIEWCPCSGVSGDTVEVELSSSSVIDGDSSRFATVVADAAGACW